MAASNWLKRSLFTVGYKTTAITSSFRDQLGEKPIEPESDRNKGGGAPPDDTQPKNQTALWARQVIRMQIKQVTNWGWLAGYSCG